MKMMLSTPSTTSRAISVASAIQASGIAIHSNIDIPQAASKANSLSLGAIHGPGIVAVSGAVGLQS
jgi:hypothetical protein